MSQKFRIREARVKSFANNRSGIITENMTSSTPDKIVGTTFKSVLVNETWEFVVWQEWNTTYVSRVALDVWTLITGEIYPLYNWWITFPTGEKYRSIELPVWTTLLTVSSIKVILHNDIPRTTIVFNLLKNWISFATITLPNGVSTITVPNTTTFNDGDRFSVEVTTWLTIVNQIATEIFIDYNLS